MQKQFDFFEHGRNADLLFIRSSLFAQFGPEPKRERGTIDDQLTGSILSARTHDEESRLAFRRLGARFHGEWSLLAKAPVRDILFPIRGVTFAEKKAVILKSVWQKNSLQHGLKGFAYLAQWPVARALNALEENPGIGRKISAAALNFSTLHGRAFVADTHVLRVLWRFGFIGHRARALQAYDSVMAVAQGLSADDLFELHWHLKYLGQQICRHEKAACDCCPLASRCMRWQEAQHGF